MEQSNLLELAKQGEPEAIAALMNAVLEPKGIRAQATLENDCLHVLLESAKGLNQVTITNFIQRGLLELEIPTIRKVRASGKRLNEKKIAWSREFSIAPAITEAISPPVEAFVPQDFERTAPPIVKATIVKAAIAEAAVLPAPPAEIPLPIVQPIAEQPVFPTIPEEILPLEPPHPAQIESLYQQPLPPCEEEEFEEEEIEEEEIEEEEIVLPPHLLLDTEEPEEFDLPLPEHLLLREDPEEEEPPLEQNVQGEDLETQGKQVNLAIRTSLRNAIAADFQTLENQDDLEEDLEEEADEQSTGRFSKPLRSFRTYALPILLVSVGSFFAGGTAAFLSTSQAPQNKMDEVLKAKNETPAFKQKEAEEYLKAMNMAQEKFYKEKNRFANSLEELERSANVISQSYSYAYRLKVSDRSIITASPRETGLRSYIGAVFLSQSGAPSAVICQTKKPSMEAPLAPEFVKGKANCDPRSAKLP